MIYILIFVIATGPFEEASVTANSVEFNSLAACQEAAKLVASQARRDHYVPVLVCAAKGQK